VSEPYPAPKPVDRLPPMKIRRLIYPDLPQVVAIERRVFPTPWSLAMFVLELSKQSGICLAATEQEQASPRGPHPDGSPGHQTRSEGPGPELSERRHIADGRAPDGQAAWATGPGARSDRIGRDAGLRGSLLRTMSPRAHPGGVEQRLLAYLICSRYDTVWHVMNLAVDVDRQQMGLASALLAELYARVDDEGARFTLEVRRSNLVAIHLYEREGFRAAGVRRRYYQDNGEDALVMWRTPSTLAERAEECRSGDWVGQLDDVPNPGPV
jgi:[ribosomal protein S18]-alanine N-acetyltransferase